jgi:hypothetical protein
VSPRPSSASGRQDAEVSLAAPPALHRRAGCVGAFSFCNSGGEAGTSKGVSVGEPSTPKGCSTVRVLLHMVRHRIAGWWSSARLNVSALQIVPHLGLCAMRIAAIFKRSFEFWPAIILVSNSAQRITTGSFVASTVVSSGCGDNGGMGGNFGPSPADAILTLAATASACRGRTSNERNVLRVARRTIISTSLPGALVRPQAGPSRRNSAKKKKSVRMSKTPEFARY